MKISRFSSVTALGAVAALALVGCAANEGGNGDGETDDDNGGSSLSGTIGATGASSQQTAQETWVAGFQEANGDSVTVNYQPTGSGTGRDNFVSGASNFIGSDRAFTIDELGEFGACTSESIVEVPMYISPVAVAFNLPGVESLNLDAETIAQIFNGDITTWNDPAIADQNDGVDLPDAEVIPVNRSDASGTTETFVTYLSAVAPDAWPHEVSNEWPIEGTQVGDGTAGVRQVIEGGENTIGYIDASQIPENAGQVHVEVEGEYVAYSAEAASALIEGSALEEGREPQDLVFAVDPAAAPAGSYPIALVSYLIACTEYEDPEVASLTKAYFEYVASAEAQDAASAEAGNAPISDGLREQVLTAVDAIVTE